MGRVRQPVAAARCPPSWLPMSDVLAERRAARALALAVQSQAQTPEAHGLARRAHTCALPALPACLPACQPAHVHTYYSQTDMPLHRVHQAAAYALQPDPAYYYLLPACLSASVWTGGSAVVEAHNNDFTP